MLKNESGIAGSNITLYLRFWEPARIFYKAALPLYILISNLWELQFLHIITNTCCLSFISKLGNLNKTTHITHIDAKIINKMFTDMIQQYIKIILHHN